MLNFLWDIRYILLVAVFIILSALLDWNNFKTKVGQLMLVAKQMAKDGTLKNGQEQAKWVVLQIYKRLPLRYRILKEETLARLVAWLYKQAMDYLDDGKINGSIEYVPEPKPVPEPEPSDVTDPPPIDKNSSSS
jgi:hypothetical protein